MPDTTVRTAGLGEFTIRSSPIEKLFRRAPAVTFFHLRDALGSMYGSHRREWLARTRVRFHRGGMRAEALNSRTETPSGFAGERTFFYRVWPRDKRPPAGAKVDLSTIRAESFTRSDAALGQELGGERRPQRGRYLAIPIGVTLDSRGRPKSRWRTPAAYRRARAGNELLALEIRGRPLTLYQVKGGKKAAQTEGALQLATPGAGRPKGRSRILLPAYRLVRRVQNRPMLKYLSTWDELGRDRGRRIARAVDRILGEL